MKLPEWAERAFSMFRPRPAWGETEPEPQSLAAWAAVYDRFSQRWHELRPDEWKVPEVHDCYEDLARTRIYPPAEYVRQCILETSIECAKEDDPKKIAEAIAELDGLNSQIEKTASILANLFTRQQSLINTGRLSEEIEPYFPFPENVRNNPFDLFDALEDVLLSPASPRHAAWSHVAQTEIEAFLRIAREQSRPGPGWPELMEAISYRHPQRIAVAADSGDQAAIASKTNQTIWSRSARRLLGRLDSWHGTFPPDFLLTCLTAAQLAVLAEVVCDAPEGKFTEDAMVKLRQKYRKEQAAARSQDDSMF